MVKLPYEDCEDCKRLVQKYGEENLNLCEYCEHYYFGEKCSCGSAQEEVKV